MQISHYTQQSGCSQYQGDLQPAHSLVFHTPETDDASQILDQQLATGFRGLNYNIPSFTDEVGHEAYTTIGDPRQACEAQWLQVLKRRVCDHSLSSTKTTSQLRETNFWLDDQDIQIAIPGNPYQLPEEPVASALFQFYLRTVDAAFPIAPLNLEEQLHTYYHSIRNGNPITGTQRWFAIINLVLAIGARFSRLVHAEWQVNPADESLYIARALQLLDLGNTSVILATPDISLIQVIGLLVTSIPRY
jgi:hypothetical protein